MSDANVVHIDHEPMELFKVLKIAGLVASGGEAKMVIAEGMVYLNGEVETRKRRKVMSGDGIAFMDDVIRVELEIDS